MSAIIPTRLAVRVLFALLVVWSCLQLGCAKSSSNEGGDSSSDTSADTGSPLDATSDQSPTVDLVGTNDSVVPDGSQEDQSLDSADQQGGEDQLGDLSADTQSDATSDSQAPDTVEPSPLAGVVIVSEIMYDPINTLDEDGEYIELYNRGDSDVDLSGFTLRDDFNNLHVIKGSLVLKAKSYLVLARNGDTVNNGGVFADYVYDNFFLGNTQDAVTLDDADGKRVFRVVYENGSSWPTTNGGVAIELKSLELDITKGENWQLAVNRYGTGDKGTPGIVNGYGPTPFNADPKDLGWQDGALQSSMRFSYFDDTEETVIKAVAAAKTSIHAAFFNLRSTKVIAALLAAKNGGVEVKIVLDQKTADLDYNKPIVDKMKSDGLDVTLVTNSRADDAIMHNKFAIFDGARVLTGSLNWTSNAFFLSDEELIWVDSTAVATLYETEFQELLAGTANDPTVQTLPAPIQVSFGTDDDLKQVVLDRINGAKTSIYAVMFAMNQSDIVDALIAAYKRGVHVVIVLDKVVADQVDYTEDERLETAGVTVLRFENKRGSDTNEGLIEVHSKLAVFDNSVVMLGSYNWTNLATGFNDENMLTIQSVALATQVNYQLTRILTSYLPSAKPDDFGWTTGTRSVNFRLRNVTLDAGASVYLVGNVAALKSLNWALAIKLTPIDDTTFETTVE
ncbi:MAG: lamin tail domain-containing protein, partial [Myxococcales bacterium]|nr:lamin tail domain-containing protein [Myxococcales bacterium]